jgi:hypothetical protein
LKGGKNTASPFFFFYFFLLFLLSKDLLMSKRPTKIKAAEVSDPSDTSSRQRQTKKDEVRIKIVVVYMART